MATTATASKGDGEGVENGGGGTGNGLWGKLKEPMELTLTGKAAKATPVTKGSIRQKVWESIERGDLANFPRPVYRRIPNFKGAHMAAETLASLPEFVASQTIKVNSDKPQSLVRLKVLESDKLLLVPAPKLTTTAAEATAVNGNAASDCGSAAVAKNLFNSLRSSDKKDDDLHKMASRFGIDNMSDAVPMESTPKVDLVVVGSVAVDKLGRRIGKGEGFADLEFAMAASDACGNAVSPDTLVVTTVHDVQVSKFIDAIE